LKIGPIGFPETSVTTILCCVTSQKNADLKYKRSCKLLRIFKLLWVAAVVILFAELQLLLGPNQNVP